MTAFKDTQTPDVKQCATESPKPNFINRAANPPADSQHSQIDSDGGGVFVYGTLMSAELLSLLLTGSSKNYKDILERRQPAILKHYRRVPLKDDDYPAIIEGTTSDQVDGFFIIPTSSSQWEQLDDFEGEEYRRLRVSVCLKESGTPVSAQVYLWNGDMDDLQLDVEWDYAYFRDNHLQEWLDLYDGNDTKCPYCCLQNYMTGRSGSLYVPCAVNHMFQECYVLSTSAWIKKIWIF